MGRLDIASLILIPQCWESASDEEFEMFTASVQIESIVRHVMAQSLDFKSQPRESPPVG